MHEIDWFGWGDWLYLITSLVAISQTFLESFVIDEDDFVGPYYALGDTNTYDTVLYCTVLCAFSIHSSYAVCN